MDHECASQNTVTGKRDQSSAGIAAGLRVGAGAGTGAGTSSGATGDRDGGRAIGGATVVRLSSWKLWEHHLLSFPSVLQPMGASVAAERS